MSAPTVNAPVPAPDPVTLQATAYAVGAALNSITGELANRFYERRSLLEMYSLAVLTNQHAFVLGPPGTAKSDITRAFFDRITGQRYFEALLSKTRPDQAVLGPYNIPRLKEGFFERNRDGYLLTTDYAMLDEIGKMSPTLGHDLLAALNERIRHEVDPATGVSAHPIPLRTAITASNEMIVTESDDAAALWDRLLLRSTVDYIAEPGNFAALLSGSVAGAARVQPKTTTVTFADLAAVADHYVPAIPIPNDVIEGLLTLRTDLLNDGVRVSDRRWRQSMRVMQAAALLAGREQVEVDDVGALRFTLWESLETKGNVERKTLKLANPLNETLMATVDTLREFRDGIASRKGKALSERAGYGTEVLGKLKTLENATKKLREECLQTGRSTTKVEEVADDIKAVKKLVYVECLDAGDLPELG